MIYFVRHGQTDWNKNKVMMGHADIPLNEKGIEYAYKLKKELANEKFDLVYCSPLIRAKQTCDIIFEDREQKVVYRDELKERDYGKYQGTAKSSFDYNKFWNYADQEGIESFFEFAWPITRFISNELLPNLGKKILIISHGGVAKWFEILLSEQSLRPEEVGSYLPKNSDIIKYDMKRKSKNPYIINATSRDKSHKNYNNISIITPNILNSEKPNSSENNVIVSSDKPKFYYRTNFIIFDKNAEMIMQHFEKTGEYKLPGKAFKNFNISSKELKNLIEIRLGLNVSVSSIKHFEDIYEIRFNDPVGEVVFTRTYYVKLDSFENLKPNFSEKENEEGGNIVVFPFYEALKLTENSLKKVKTLESDSKNFRPLKTKESIVFRDQILIRHFLNFALLHL